MAHSVFSGLTLAIACLSAVRAENEPIEEEYVNFNLWDGNRISVQEILLVIIGIIMYLASIYGLSFWYGLYQIKNKEEKEKYLIRQNYSNENVQEKTHAVGSV